MTPPLLAVDLKPEGEAHFGRGPSSKFLKLFSYSRQAEFYGSSSSSVSRIFGNGDISGHIAMHLAPTAREKMLSLKWYTNLNAFVRVCTTTYASGVAVLYQNVANVSNLWAMLLGNQDQIGRRRVNNLMTDTVILSYLLAEIYGDHTRDLSGEDNRSYKLRRFFFICSHVQVLWANPETFPPALSVFFMKHIPADSQYLFPALKRISWIDKDRSQPKMALRTSPIELPVFQAFRPFALRFLEFEFHDLSVPLSSVLRDEKSIARIRELISNLHQSFPNIHTTTLCICRPDYGAVPVSRLIINVLDVAVMKTDATVISDEIPYPFLNRTRPETYGIMENVSVDIVTAKGRTFMINPNARDYYYSADGDCIMAALSALSPVSFSLAYDTNMTLAQISNKAIIETILEPFFDKRNMQCVILHLKNVAVHLKPVDIVRIGSYWRQLLRLDLRFSVIREKTKHMPTVGMVRVLTSLCPALEYLHLPDFNVLGFRVADSEVASLNLRHMTSTTLMSCDGDADVVASGLLSWFPNLTDVMTEGVSDRGWASIGKAIHVRMHGGEGGPSFGLVAGLVTPGFTEEELEDLLRDS